MAVPDADEIMEKVYARAASDMADRPRPRSWISAAIHDGILLGFRRARDELRIKRQFREDARRLAIHARELREWDVGDDHATAFEIEEISERLSKRYGLTIGKEDT